MNAIAKYGIITLIVLGLLLLGAYFLTRKKNVLSSRVIRVGHLEEFPFFWYKNGNAQGDPGIDADLLKIIFKRLGITKVEYTKFPTFQTLYGALENNQIDIAAGDLWVVAGRAKQFNFTTPYYYQGGLGMVFKKGRENEFRTINDLAEKNIGILTGSDDIENWLPKYHFKSVKEYKTIGDLIDAVVKGEIDVALDEYGAFKSEEVPNKKNINSVFLQPVSAAFATHHGDTILNHQLDNTIKSMWKDHSLYWTKSKYLPEYLIEPFNWEPPSTLDPSPSPKKPTPLYKEH